MKIEKQFYSYVAKEFPKLGEGLTPLKFKKVTDLVYKVGFQHYGTHFLDSTYQAIDFKNLRRSGLRDIEEINKNLGLLESIPPALGICRGFRLTNKAENIIRGFLNSVCPSKTPPRTAIKSKAGAKNIRQSSNRLSQFQIDCKVSINIKQIDLAIQYLRSKETRTDRDKTCLRQLMLLKANSREGYIYQEYQEYPDGRIYGIHSPNLPTSCTEVRKAALHGYWEYDVENCHFVLLNILCMELGIDAPFIKQYASNKTHLRNEISNECGLPIREVKAALLSLLYGSSLQNPEGALKEILGDGLQSILENKHFTDLANDIKSCRRKIIRHYADKHCKYGCIYNVVSKPIKVERKKTKTSSTITNTLQIFSHIITGMEANILWKIGETFSKDLVLLQHDGFVLKHKVNPMLLEQVIHSELGYSVDFSETKLENIFTNLPQTRDEDLGFIHEGYSDIGSDLLVAI